MRWEELTGDEFAKAVKTVKGVCVLAWGCIERHGPHMPLGTDMLNGLHVAEQAARREPAIVFPPWFVAQINEARCFPGTIALPPELVLAANLAILDEIGRNGLTKIVLFVSHGGNNHLAAFLSQAMLYRQRPYRLYVVYADAAASQEQIDRMQALLDVPRGGHADEWETSIMLGHRPDLLKMRALKGGRGGQDLGRLKRLIGNTKTFYSLTGWYAKYPEHYAGDARKATADKGRKIVDILATALADFIARVKADTVMPALEAEFFGRVEQVSSPGRRKR